MWPDGMVGLTEGQEVVVWGGGGGGGGELPGSIIATRYDSIYKHW